MSMPQPDGLELRHLPDSTDARMFVELSNCFAELVDLKSLDSISSVPRMKSYQAGLISAQRVQMLGALHVRIKFR